MGKDHLLAVSCKLPLPLLSSPRLPCFLWCILPHSFTSEHYTTSPPLVPLQASLPLASPLEQSHSKVSLHTGEPYRCHFVLDSFWKSIGDTVQEANFALCGIDSHVRVWQNFWRWPLVLFLRTVLTRCSVSFSGCLYCSPSLASFPLVALVLPFSPFYTSSFLFSFASSFLLFFSSTSSPSLPPPPPTSSFLILLCCSCVVLWPTYNKFADHIQCFPATDWNVSSMLNFLGCSFITELLHDSPFHSCLSSWVHTFWKQLSCHCILNIKGLGAPGWLSQ